MTAVRVAVAALIAALCVLIPTGPAWAHAALLASTPADGVLLAAQPGEIVLTFSEKVATGLGAVKVVGPDGRRADTGDVSTRDGGREVIAPLRDGLPQGTYVLLWRVVSEDSHPVAGASTFSVGKETPTAGLSQDQGGGAARELLPVSRWLLYAGLAVLVGGMAFLLVLWPDGAATRRVRRLVWTGWTLAAVGAVSGLLLQGPYAAGLPLSDALDPPLVREVFASKYGTASAVRLALLAVAAGLLVGLGRLPRRVLALGAVPVGAGLLVTTSLTGHAAAGSMTAVAVPADALHLAAMSAWAGGLAVLAVAALRSDPARLRALLPAWSRYAAASVTVLVFTGLFASWREVREVPALRGTDYGRLLIAKTALVLVMLALGGLASLWVRRRYMTVAFASTDEAVAQHAASAPPDAGRLRRSVLVEVAVAVAVLGVTSWLVGTTPARSAYAPLFTQTEAVAGDLRVQVDVEPARAGLNDMHVYFTGKGSKAVDVEEVTARWTLVGGSDEVPVDLPRDTLGHYERLRVPLPSPGTWRLTLTTRVSDIDSYTTQFTVRVR